MPEDEGVHVGCQELTEVLQLTREGKQCGEAELSHWVFLCTFLPTLHDQCFGNQQRDSKFQLKRYFLEYGRVAVILVIHENVPKERVLDAEAIDKSSYSVSNFKRVEAPIIEQQIEYLFEAVLN